MAAPPDEGSRTVTRLLAAWGRGSEEAREHLFALVYAELRRRARAQLRRESSGHTLRPTALVNEAYLRLAGQDRAAWQNRSQFFAVASCMMRRVLVDHARAKRAGKRPDGRARVELNEGLKSTAPREVDLVALDQALDELAQLSARPSQVVELRYFGGLDVPEAAGVLGVSVATVERDWRFARAWLRRRLD
ncbi:MAG TPA: ECF-type sigma factor [Vicinamibacteria bacterium]